MQGMVISHAQALCMRYAHACVRVDHNLINAVCQYRHIWLCILAA